MRNGTAKETCLPPSSEAGASGAFLAFVFHFGYRAMPVDDDKMGPLPNSLQTLVDRFDPSVFDAPQGQYLTPRGRAAFLKEGAGA
jgi:hypothetical protein